MSMENTENKQRIVDNVVPLGSADELLARIAGAPNSPGNRALRSYWSGRPLGYKASLLAKCAECCCYYIDGRQDCEVPACPLYPYMPYGKYRYLRKDRRPTEPTESVETPLGESLDGGEEIE